MKLFFLNFNQKHFISCASLIGLLSSLLLTSSLGFANTNTENYSGNIKQASGLLAYFNKQSCHVQIKPLDEHHLLVNLRLNGKETNFSEQLTLNKKDVYVGEKLYGYSYGLTTEKALPKGHTEKTHTILKFSQQDSKIKIYKVYQIDQGLLYNQGAYYSFECVAEKN